MDVCIISPGIVQVTEQFHPLLIDVSSAALPKYDHVPLVSEAENVSVDGVYVCSPGIGVFLVPAIDVETDSEVSPSTSAPEMLGVTVNEYVAPASSSVNVRLRAVLPTFRISGVSCARTSVTVKSSTRMHLVLG